MKVQKRHGDVVDFDPSMVVAAICKAFAAVGREGRGRSRELAERVEVEAQRRFGDGTIGIAVPYREQGNWLATDSYKRPRRQQIIVNITVYRPIDLVFVCFSDG